MAFCRWFGGGSVQEEAAGVTRDLMTHWDSSWDYREATRGGGEISDVFASLILYPELLLHEGGQKKTRDLAKTGHSKVLWTKY